MKHSKRLFLLTFSLIFLYSFWFSWKTIKHKADQFKIDWNHATKPWNTKTINVLPVLLQYNRVDFVADTFPEFSSDWLYTLETPEGIFYFHPNYIRILNDTVSFRYIRWLNNIYPKQNHKGILYPLFVKLKQEGNIAVVTFGDTYMIYKQANFLRKRMDENFPDLLFTGNHSDIFNYPHQAVLIGNMKSLFQKALEAPKAEYYLLFFGLHDDNMPIEIWQEKAHNIIKTIVEQKAGKKVFLFLLPGNKPRLIERNRFFENIRNKKIELVNVNEIIGFPENFDTISEIPTAQGYEMIARYLSERIKQNEKEKNK